MGSIEPNKRIMKNFNIELQESEDLKNLRNQITRELNRRAKVLRNQLKAHIQEGDRVTIDHPKTDGKVLIVRKMKIKRADVVEEGDTFNRFTVPITMLQKLLK
jgi:formamidopyrimidine-DNA glycosylase